MSKVLKKLIFVTLLIFVGAIYSSYPAILKPDSLYHITIFDVGQGDSILIGRNNDFKFLIDGGPDSRASNYLKKMFPVSGCYLDYVALTHPHYDHLAGLIDVLKLCRVGLVITTTQTADTKVFQLWESELREGTASGRIKDVVRVKNGDIFSAGNSKIEVLWPQDSLISSRNPNLESLIFMFSVGEFDALLTGDAEKEVYDSIYSHTRLQKFTENGSLEVLKVPHHGSIDGLNEDFVKKVGPDVSVISVGGGNRYDHPSNYVVNFLLNLGSKVYRTDINGTVEISTDGAEFKVETQK